MKIAILTLPLNINYGGILQCYALQTVLERMGYNVEVLHVFHKGWQLRIRFFIRKLIVILVKKISQPLACRSRCNIIQKCVPTIIIQKCVSAFISEFINKYINIREIENANLIKETDYGTIVVGSDQIWRPLYFQPIENAYLKFAKDWTYIKRIAYAASFGTDEWEYTPEETIECASLLKLFDAVSVRESSGIDLCKKYLETDAVQVLDPTLLLTKDDYLNLIERSNVRKHEGGLFYYFLGITSEKMYLAEEFAEKQGLELYAVNNYDVYNSSVSFEKRIQYPVEDWIAGFRDASFVVTDSFHGCVFSIIFNKPFIVIGNVKRGMARFNSLLSMFGLEDRLIAISDVVRNCQLPEINWDIVNSKLAINRQLSFSFLHETMDKES